MKFIILILISVFFSSVFSADDSLLPSTLLDAASKGDVDGIQKAIDEGALIDVTNPNGWSAAMFCVFNGDMRGLQKLIDLGINLNAVDNKGFTPLMLAASQSDKELVEVLLAGNASPLITTADGATAYSMATDAGRKVVAFLIAEASVLHGIESSDSDAQIEYLKHGAYIDIRNRAGYTPLISAASTGNLEAVKQLVNMGADCNRVENDGWSPLHFAAVQGNEEMVKVLLKANAAPGLTTSDGRTPKMIAEQFKFTTIVDVLPDVQEMTSPA